MADIKNKIKKLSSDLEIESKEIKKFKEVLKEFNEVLEAKRGRDGRTPVKGVDYFTQKDIDAIIKASKPILGVDYQAPERGVPGVKGEKGERGKDGRDGKDGKDGVTQVIHKIKQVTNKDVKDIVEKIEALKGDDRLDARKLKNLSSEIARIAGGLVGGGGGAGGGAETFTDLTDTPASYTGLANQVVVVNATESGLETLPVSTVTENTNEYTELIDTPNSYVGDGDKLIRVNTAETGTEHVTLASIADGTYLRLDTSNDPLTGGLQISPTADEVTLGINANATQTANTFEMKDGTGTLQGVIDNAGSMGIRQMKVPASTAGGVSFTSPYPFTLQGTVLGDNNGYRGMSIGVSHRHNSGIQYSFFNNSGWLSNDPAGTAQVVNQQSSMISSGTGRATLISSFNGNNTINGSLNVSLAYGVRFFATVANDGATVGDLTAGQYTNTIRGTVTRAVGVELRQNSTGAGSATDVYGLWLRTNNEAHTGTVTIANRWGIKLDDVDIATTNNYAIETGLGLVKFGDDVEFEGGIIDNANSTGAGGEQLTADGLGGFNWSAPATQPLVSDADGDTRVSVEQTPDDDFLRLIMQNQELMTLKPATAPQISEIINNAGSWRVQNPVTEDSILNYQIDTLDQDALQIGSDGTTNMNFQKGKVNIGDGQIADTGLHIRTNTRFTSTIEDLNGDAGLNGYIMQSTGTHFEWNDPATSLGGTFVKQTEVGAANGVAELDGTGKVPATQLPSYVDDVIEFANLAAFPGTGETGKIYVALDTNKTYRWSGATYIEISPSEVNSVNGNTGVVVLDTDDINEGTTNLYYTEARVNANTNVAANTADRHASGSDNQNLWSTINGDTGSTTANTQTDTLTIAGGTNVTTSIVGDTLTIDATTTGAPDQNLWETVNADTGTTTADTTTDTLTIAGGEGIDTSIVGDTLTITGEDASETNKGIVELATIAEVNAGTDNTRAITPASLEGSQLQTDVDANTASRHDAVTVTDSATIDFTLTGQNITASVIESALTVSASYNVVTTAINYNAAVGDYVRINSTGISVTLPTAVGADGKVIIVKNVVAGGPKPTVETTGAETIDGNSNLVIQNQWDTFTFISNGTNWEII